MSAIAEHQSQSPVPAGKRCRPVLSRRGAAYWLSGLLAVTATVNCLLTFLVPGILRGTALWLPFIAVAGGWLWRRRPWGFLVIGGALAMWVLESASIAVDQWYGHAADPASPAASAVFTPAFGVLALIGLVPAYCLFRSLRNDPHRRPAASRMPVAGHRCWQAWILAGILLLVGAAGVFGGVSLIPDGFGMPLSWLHQTPFTSWTLPGVAMLAGVTVPQFTALALIVSGHRWALAASYLAGAGLVLWIAVQMLVLQRYFILQSAIAAAGAAEMLLARLWQRAQAAPGGLPAVPLTDSAFGSWRRQ